MAKVYLLEDSDSETSYGFFCPGCECGHYFITKRSSSGPKWCWNQDFNKPTIHPSIFVMPNDPEHRCHMWIIAGVIEYLPDSHHHLKGQKIEMIDDD